MTSAKHAVSQLELNFPMLDYVSLTSYDTGWYVTWIPYVANGERQKVMQYQGKRHANVSGTIWAGHGEQGPADHYMVKISGALADDLRETWTVGLRQKTATTTRIDLQITINCPKSWEQWELLTRTKGRGKTVGWIESKSGQNALETVYIGSRKANRMTRVYIKESASGERLLRLETEYKGPRAKLVANHLAKGGRVSDYLLYELKQVIRDTALAKLFEPFLIGTPRTEVVKLTTNLEKRRKWLLNTVLPAFSEYINDHQANGDVAEEFDRAIQNVDKTLTKR